ncbi:hypothetical protein SAMN02910400_01064 [Lachnospiraceae bacterium C10]|nr:hypothetical protein SAMN02910400_01064 [Lachnospiraceae bacterium C10]
MNKQILKIAAETMKVPIEVAENNYKELPERNAFYFWNPVRGGIAVIVGANGEKLGASSGISFDQHLQAFVDGKRN